IGKSRLVTELLESIDGEAAVAVGQCLDTGGAVGAPFASIKGIVQDLGAAFGAEALLEAAGRNADVLTSLVPRLDRGRPGDRPDLGEASGEDVHEAFGDVLEALSEERPIVVLLEDLHWADVTTLALLSALLRRLRRSRVLVLLTYRPEDLGRGHPLRPLLIQLDRNPAVDRVELAALDEETVAEQAGLILGRRLDQLELSQVVRRSDGVPFFVEEFLGASSPGAGLPSTLRELVMARYERLTPVTQRVLRALAAGGATVDHDLAETVLAGEPGELDAAVAEAVERGILVAGPFDYRFRHALLREGILDVLLPGERSQWHSRYALTLSERPDAESHGVQIAQHWMSAHDLPRAFDATVRAMLSSSTLAPATAAQLGERAIDLWPQVPDAAQVAGRPLEQLMHETAQEHMAADNAPRAAAIWESALQACPPDEILMRAGILMEKAVCDHERGFDVDASLEEALRLLEGCPETPEIIRRRSYAMATRAMCGADRMGPARAHKVALDALDLALQAGSPGDAARAATFAALMQVMKGEFDEGLAAFDDARAHLPDDPLVNWRHGYVRGIALLGLGRYERARADLGRAVTIAQGAGRTQLSGAGAMAVLTTATLKDGGWPAAERLAQALMSGPPTLDATVTSAATLLFLHHWRGQREEALAMAADRDHLLREGTYASSVPDLLAALGEIALEDGPDRAWAVLDSSWERPDLEVAHSHELIV
ncbi:MAG: AAA family ATPase, partial [Actinomycetales bacterium]|nr:AAA family ATPase [Actinomycetales bacterium]